MKSRVIFFDFWGTLLRRTETDSEYNALINLEHVCAAGRFGILANVKDTADPNELHSQLTSMSLAKFFDPDLIVPSGIVGPALPNPAAFKIAAAIAGLPVDECTFVTCDTNLGRAASAAGMIAQVVPFLAGGPVSGDYDKPSLFEQFTKFVRGEVDEDTGPTFILKGRVVSMRAESEIIPNARVLIRKGKIEGVLTENQTLPEAFSSAIELNTGGTIYPGLMDLHNHFAYNVLPLWVVPKKYENRDQWPRHREYQTSVSHPLKNILAEFSSSSKAIARYVEAKALLSGTTTGQGIRTMLRGGPSVFRGAIRSVEDTADLRLPESVTKVKDLVITGTNSIAEIDKFRSTLTQMEKNKSAFFYHLAEGTDESAHKHFDNLKNNDLILSSLAAIHSLGLKKEDLDVLATKEAKVVWSPFSNLLLYGETLNLQHLKKSGVLFCIGCDWSPTGSKNSLQELKVSAFENARQGNIFSAFELVQAVTTNAARIAGWDRVLGTVQTNNLADLLVIAGEKEDPYLQLINAIEKDVRLVTVHGVPRYGDLELLRAVIPDFADKIEEWQVEGIAKGFYLFSESSKINDVTFAGAEQLLKEAMKDLSAFRQKMQTEGMRLQSLEVDRQEEFTLELDNEIEDDFLLDDDDMTTYTLAKLTENDEIQNNIELDPPFVNAESYWSRIDSQKNISIELKEALKKAYCSQ